MNNMKFISLFAGIGGFDIGLERAGMECVGQVEIDEFCLKVLKKHWPHVKRLNDIREVKGDEFGRVDLVCGGFPCQPFSVAGKRKGTDDNRHLWPEMLRVIQAVKPTWVIAENVRGLLTIEQGMVFEQVCVDLEATGYEVQPVIIPACAVDAPHRRDRVWFVAYSNNARNRTPSGRLDRNWQTEIGEREQSQLESRRHSENVANTRHRTARRAKDGLNRQQQNSKTEKIGTAKRHGLTNSSEDAANADDQRCEECHVSAEHEVQRRNCWRDDEGRSVPGSWQAELPVCVVDDGISGRLVKYRGRTSKSKDNQVKKIKALGNAVVPQVVEVLGRIIMKCSRVKVQER